MIYTRPYIYIYTFKHTSIFGIYGRAKTDIPLDFKHKISKTLHYILHATAHAQYRTHILPSNAKSKEKAN